MSYEFCKTDEISALPNPCFQTNRPPNEFNTQPRLPELNYTQNMTQLMTLCHQLLQKSFTNNLGFVNYPKTLISVIKHNPSHSTLNSRNSSIEMNIMMIQTTKMSTIPVGMINDMKTTKYSSPIDTKITRIASGG